jgi:hypothetical protein
MSQIVALILARAVAEVIYGEGDPPPNPNPNPPPPNPNPNPPPVKTFTQAEVDRMMAEHRQALQRKNSELETQLKQRIDSGNLTEQQVKEAQEQIERLQAEYQTKDVQQTTEIKRLNEKYESDRKKWEKDAGTWQDRFTTMLTNNELMGAAVQYKAYNPQQVVALLQPLSRKVEKLGPDGKPTGEFEIKVKFMGQKDGKPVQLDLSPADTVKLMTEMPEQYGNLFISAATGGLGSGNGSGGAKPPITDLSKLSDKEYEERRDEILRAAEENTKVR